MYCTVLEDKLNATDVQVEKQRTLVTQLQLEMKGTQTHVEITVLV